MRTITRAERRLVFAFFVLLFGIYTCVYPYITVVNNPNENVRTYMTMAIVENHTFRIDDIVTRQGWVNDMARAPETKMKAADAIAFCNQMTGPCHLYSVKAPAVSYLGVPIYWAFTRFSHPPKLETPPDERISWMRKSTFVLRLFTIQLPCFLFLIWLERWLRRISGDVVLRLAAAAERRSEHPLARAIVEAAASLPIANAEFVRAEAGFGVEAKVEGRVVHIGAKRYMDKLGIDASRASLDAARLWKEAKTTIFVALDHELAALLAVSDTPRAASGEAIARLRALGLEVGVVSGDGRASTEAIASLLGIGLVLAERLPNDKAEDIRQLQAKGRHVVFVGDGINDAPALATANVGVAMGTGTDIAIESGDVVLMRGDLRAAADAIALSRRALRTIHQNFFWAYGYNIALIPLAAGALFPLVHVLLSPVLAAAAMSSSSIFVLANSLRLRRFRA